MKVKASAETFKTSEISIESVFRGRDGITLPFNSPHPDIPVFDVKTLPPDEMAREKLEAVMSRNKARDLFDLYILLKNY
ncbi:MAG: nucleotidyl transferase AbiEii/AbiGii toxin family protein, partial [Candidatus Freyarchaeota archaeon]